MTHRELERMARERYGPQALVIIDRTRPDKARREEIRERVSLRDCPEAQAACDRVDAAAEAAAKRVRAAQESE